MPVKEMSVKPVPAGYHTVTPYLTVSDAMKLIDFLKDAFDAQLTAPPMRGPDGRVMHAEVRIGDSLLMIGEPMGEVTPMPAYFYVYVSDVDATYKKALKAGATSLNEPATHFYGDRTGGVQDPSGNRWWIATHVEDVSPEEMARRSAKPY